MVIVDACGSRRANVAGAAIGAPGLEPELNPITRVRFVRRSANAAVASVALTAAGPGGRRRQGGIRLFHRLAHFQGCATSAVQVWSVWTRHAFPLTAPGATGSCDPPQWGVRPVHCSKVVRWRRERQSSSFQGGSNDRSADWAAVPSPEIERCLPAHHIQSNGPFVVPHEFRCPCSRAGSWPRRPPACRLQKRVAHLGAAGLGRVDRGEDGFQKGIHLRAGNGVHTHS